MSIKDRLAGARSAVEDRERREAAEAAAAEAARQEAERAKEQAEQRRQDRKSATRRKVVDGFTAEYHKAFAEGNRQWEEYAASVDELIAMLDRKNLTPEERLALEGVKKSADNDLQAVQDRIIQLQERLSEKFGVTPEPLKQANEAGKKGERKIKNHLEAVAEEKKREEWQQEVEAEKVRLEKAVEEVKNEFRAQIKEFTSAAQKAWDFYLEHGRSVGGVTESNRWQGQMASYANELRELAQSQERYRAVVEQKQAELSRLGMLAVGKKKELRKQIAALEEMLGHIQGRIPELEEGARETEQVFQGLEASVKEITDRMKAIRVRFFEEQKHREETNEAARAASFRAGDLWRRFPSSSFKLELPPWVYCSEDGARYNVLFYKMQPSQEFTPKIPYEPVPDPEEFLKTLKD